MKIKKERNKLGISQMRLSKLTGVSRYRIHLFECGYASLKKYEVKQIQTVLNQKLDSASGEKHDQHNK